MKPRLAKLDVRGVMPSFPTNLPLGAGTTLRLDSTRLLLCFAVSKTLVQVEAAIREFHLVPEDPRLPAEKPERFHFVNHTSTRVWVRTRDGKPLDESRLAAIEKKLPDLLWLGPVYETPDTPGPRGRGCPLPHVLLVKPRPRLDVNAEKKLAALLAGMGLREDAIKSRYLAPYRYFSTEPRPQIFSFAMRAALLEKAPEFFSDIVCEYMPMVVPLATVPSDTHFDRQWNMTRIGAGGPGVTGWDLSTGTPSVVICLLDWGCDRSHPDLNFVSDGINLGTMTGNGDGVPGAFRYHGTCCAGIAAARFNNASGVAGVAGNCRILPVAFDSFTNAEVAAGINYATAHGASVISMSFGLFAPDPFTLSLVTGAIENAVNVHDCVLVASAGNDDHTSLLYPAAHSLVIAVGGSDQADNRKSPASPDGECWGANYGNISVVAPAVLIPTTDRRGTDGLNTTGGGPRHSDCVDYAVTGDAAGDYAFLFNGTSAAAPHVAGLAALLRSRYPALTHGQVRSIIERTAEKVGVLPYEDAAVFTNGSRNIEMGYGRINVLRALDLGDVFIKDWPRDDGVEPSTPPGGNFWDFSDIVVRPSDDDVFSPSDVPEANRVERGHEHFLYVRVTNNGPQEARTIVVSARITPFVGIEFVYPGDWTATDATHVVPAALPGFPATLPAGGSAIAKFSISTEQVEALWGWTNDHRWHPCILASVTADNDFAFAGSSSLAGGFVTRRNNLAQRNLSVVEVARSTTFPFVAGNHFNEENHFEIVVDRSALPRDAEVLLALDEDGRAFPRVDFSPKDQPHPSSSHGEIVLLDRSTFEVTCGNHHGVLTLEKGSRWECRPARQLSKVTVKGGELVLRNDQRFVAIRETIAVVRAQKRPKGIYPLSLRVTFASGTAQGFQHVIRVSQRNEKGATVGGATAVFHVQ